jgi:hypothetical protein
MRRADFVLELPETSVSLEARPFFFASAILLSIEVVTPPASGDQTISVELTNIGGDLEFTIANPGGELSIAEDDTRLHTLSSLIIALGGELKQSGRQDPADRIVFHVPGKR